MALLPDGIITDSRVGLADDPETRHPGHKWSAATIVFT